MVQKEHSDSRREWLPRLLLVVSTALWGASFIFTKGLFLSEPHITPVVIATLRLCIASAVFIPLLALTHRLQPIHKGDFKVFLLLSFCEPFLYSILETSGVGLVPASLASIIIATIPLFTPFGMALAYKERLRWIVVVGVLLSLVGIGVMMLGPDLTISANPRGVLYLVLAVIVAVCYTLVLVKVLKRYHPVTVTAYQNLFSIIYFIPLMLILNHDVLPLLSYSLSMWGRLAFLGVLCSTLAYVFYNYGIRAAGATAASAYTNLIPVFSLFLAVGIGQESLSVFKVIGIVIVLIGLFLAQRR